MRYNAEIHNHILDQRGLRVAPSIPDIDDERNPSIMNYGLRRGGWVEEGCEVRSRLTRETSITLMILS